MVSLVAWLPAWGSPTFFVLGFLRSLWRVLRRRLRRIAGIAIQPGLQLIDPLFQLGNFFQRLAQSLLKNQDISLNFWGELLPNLRAKRSCLHKTVTNTLFTKVQSPIFLKKSAFILTETERLHLIYSILLISSPQGEWANSCPISVLSLEGRG